MGSELERSTILAEAIRDSIAQLDFKPTPREVSMAIGRLLIAWGEQLHREQFPEVDPRDLFEVEKYYYLRPTFGGTFIRQGHIMLSGWKESANPLESSSIDAETRDLPGS